MNVAFNNGLVVTEVTVLNFHSVIHLLGTVFDIGIFDVVSATFEVSPEGFSSINSF
jgi:hypothetical protein